MIAEQVLEADDPVPLATQLLSDRPPAEWLEEHIRLEELLYFYGRIYGGGLSHAIGAAPDGAIPEAMRLARTYGSPPVSAWVAKLEAYFANGVLFAPKATREEWESHYNDFPDPRFEELYVESHAMEVEVGRAICQYIREHIDAFRKDAS